MQCDNEVMVLGSATLTEDEIELLNLGPKFMVSSALSSQEMSVEAGVTMTKLRWGRMGKGQEGMSDRQALLDDIEEQDEEAEEAARMMEDEQRDVMSTDARELDMRRNRATDMKNNRQVHMPGPESPLLEAMHSTRMGVWREVHDKYMKEHCNKSGEQLQPNITPSQQLALKSLQRKVARMELVILEADKGGKFVVMDESMYVSMAQDHLHKDKVVDETRVRRAQRVLSSTGKALVSIFGVGKSQSDANHARCHSNAGSEAEDTPTLKLLPKIHKKFSEAGHPQSRPVVAAASGMTSRAGDVLADILTPMVNVQVPRLEDMSTEEVMAQLADAQHSIWTDGDIQATVGSLDVKALYPSLDVEGSVQIVANMIVQSDVEIKGVDLCLAQVFLASNLDEQQVKDEGLSGLLPDRVWKYGRRPGPTMPELSC